MKRLRTNRRLTANGSHFQNGKNPRGIAELIDSLEGLTVQQTPGRGLGIFTNKAFFGNDDVTSFPAHAHFSVLGRVVGEWGVELVGKVKGLNLDIIKWLPIR